MADESSAVVGVVDVAEMVLARLGPLDALKLHRLVYYVQAWHYTWLGVPLFVEPMVAGGTGPVVRELVTACGGRFSLRSVGGNAGAEIGVASSGVIDFVVAEYGALRGQVLATSTQVQGPWLDAFVRGANETISLESMREYNSTDRRLLESRDFWIGGRKLETRAGPVNGDVGHDQSDDGDNPSPN